MYPQAIFIVTTRPHAVEEGWLDRRGFSDAELQPMELNDIHTFIDHWHAAVAEDIYDEEAKTALFAYAQHLKDEVETNRSKRNLATNPLLCAMLCALNWERRQELPSDRIELYEACCQLLIERRDKERRIELADYPAHALKYNQKRLLLEDLAYWFMRNDWSEVEVDIVDKRFSRRLQNMFGIPEDISGADVRRFLVERSNIIREPVVGHIDFTHRTFQEFLAARAALDEGDLGVLIEHANNDQWSEVIVLASGLAPRKIREKLIQKLIARGDAEKESQYKLHLLAVSCLESSLELEQRLKKEIQKRLSALVPPTDLTQAQALAAAGELAVPYLVLDKQYPISTITSCIYALAFIGGRAAMKVLETYANDKRPAVVDELWRARDAFDKLAYAQCVLSKTLQETFSRPPVFLSSLDGFQCFTELTALNLSNCVQITDLSPLAHLTQLTSLDLSGCSEIGDLSPLASLTELTSLNLSGCSKVNDFSPLAHLMRLTSLNLSGCDRVRDLEPLSHLTQLTSLNLSNCRSIGDLRPLAGLGQLIDLDLRYCEQVRDLSPIRDLKKLEKLTLYGMPHRLIIPGNIAAQVTIYK